MDFESRELEFKQAYVIVVIFGMNHGYMMLDDHFESNCGYLDAYLDEQELGFL